MTDQQRAIRALNREKENPESEHVWEDPYVAFLVGYLAAQEESERGEQIGWVMFDGDEYHDFQYKMPGDVLAGGYLPVYVQSAVQQEADPSPIKGYETVEEAKVAVHRVRDVLRREGVE